MTVALSPDLAVAYVTELSADVRAVIVLDAAGEILAGDPRLHPAARAARRAADTGAAAVRTPDAVVTVAVTRDHTVLVLAGPRAFEGPTLIDTRTAAAALAAGVPDVLPDTPSEGLKTAVEREISAIARQIT